MSDGAEFYAQQQCEEQEAYENEKFHAWLFENKTICNGNDMIGYMEDGFTYEEYLRGK